MNAVLVNVRLNGQGMPVSAWGVASCSTAGHLRRTALANCPYAGHQRSARVIYTVEGRIIRMKALVPQNRGSTSLLVEYPNGPESNCVVR